MLSLKHVPNVFICLFLTIEDTNLLLYSTKSETKSIGTSNVEMVLFDYSFRFTNSSLNICTNSFSFFDGRVVRVVKQVCNTLW